MTQRDLDAINEALRGGRASPPERRAPAGSPPRPAPRPQAPPPLDAGGGAAGTLLSAVETLQQVAISHERRLQALEGGRPAESPHIPQGPGPASALLPGGGGLLPGGLPLAPGPALGAAYGAAFIAGAASVFQDKHPPLSEQVKTLPLDQVAHMARLRGRRGFVGGFGRTAAEELRRRGYVV